MAWNTKVDIGDTIGSGNQNALIDIIEGISGSHYGHSSNINKHITDHGNLNGLEDNDHSQYYLSANTYNGYDNISSQAKIPHGLGTAPSYVSVVPSGNNVNFGVSCKVDASDITVYLTAPGSWDVFWKAEK